MTAAPTRLKVCVVGAGAIGSHIAAKLAAASIETSVIARGIQLETIRRNGITVIEADRQRTARVQASDHGRDLGPQDIVISCLKAPSLPAALPAIAPLLKPDTAMVCMQNGIPWWYFHGHGGSSEGRRLDLLDPDEAIWNTIGPQRAIGGVVYSSATVTAPGVVTLDTETHRFVLGEPDGSASERLETAAAALRSCGFAIDTTNQIRTAIWQKLMLNVATGPLSVLTQSPPAEVFKAPDSVATALRAMNEVVRIATAWHCDLAAAAVASREAFENRFRVSHHMPSIAQDYLAGRMMEIDAIYGIPVALGREAGIEVPTLGLLSELVKAKARIAGLYR